MIVTAFAEGNREVLRNLLAPSVFESFAAALAEREKRGEKITTTFVSIDKVVIDGAALHGKTGRNQDPFHQPDDHRDTRPIGDGDRWKPRPSRASR